MADLAVFLALRETISPVLESALVLDRLLFLRENNANHSFSLRLFPVFDEVAIQFSCFITKDDSML